MNESTRQKKVARVIQRELGDIFQRDKSLTGNAFVTITEVEITPDLAMASVYISMMLVKDTEAVINLITNKKGEIRGKLGNIIGKQMRIVPDLEFYVDQIQEDAMRIDSIIDNLNIPPAPEDEVD